MAKEIQKQHLVEKSSNIESVGFYNGTPSSPDTGVINIRFARGGVYDYYPCTEKEFQQAFEPDTLINEWFAMIKNEKKFNRIL